MGIPLLVNSRFAIPLLFAVALQAGQVSHAARAFVDTVRVRLVDTVGTVLPAPASTTGIVLQVVSAIAALATVPAAIAAWRAAAAAKASADAAAQQATTSSQQWTAQREEVEARRKASDAKLSQFAQTAHQRVDSLSVEIVSVGRARTVGWLRGLYTELRELEPMLRDLVISSSEVTETRQQVAREAYRHFSDALAALGLFVRLSFQLTDRHEPQGTEAAMLGLAMYSEHLEKCLASLGDLKTTVAPQQTPA